MKISEPVLKEIRSMMHEGLSDAEIGRRVGFARTTINGYRTAWNIPKYTLLRKSPIMAKYMVCQRRVHQSETLCWKCANAVPDSNGHGCPWSRSFEPVEGWVAEPASYISNRMGKRVEIQSYEVRSCPLFEGEGGAER